jgi:hypothetical protein
VTILFVDKAVKTERMKGLGPMRMIRNRRDPENRVIDDDNEVDRREKMIE